jgi:HEAT repeat protein
MMGLDPEDLSRIEKYLYPESLGPENDDTLFEGLGVYDRLGESLNAAAKIDRDLFLKAGLCVVASSRAAAVYLSETSESLELKAPLVFSTCLGVVRIGTRGPDTHQGPVALIIDPGGDDIYRGPVASGEDGSCGVVIDLAGNDVYIGEDKTQGAGIRGVGVLLDLEGNDIYRAGNGSQGVGLFGLGLLYDARGNDQYSAERFAQAAATWGYGGLVDVTGDDTYRCGEAGQAYTWLPGAAALCDGCGNDRYVAGFDDPDPRDPDMQKSFAQGFSIGMREMCAGGTALLADGGGNDLYHGQYFSQGSSYWQAVGLLYDAAGRDTYIARRYSQGAGIHTSFGMLLDPLGDDHTISWGVSQGCGHDWGVGVLVNEKGNDSYVGDWLCMGASEANGLGIFSDNLGNDGYEIRSGGGTGRLIRSRRSGGLGLFMDADGDDRYSMNGGNDLFWGLNRWAVGADASLNGRSGLSLAAQDRVPPVCRQKGIEKKNEEKELLEELLDETSDLPMDERVERLLEISSHWGLEKGVPKKAQKMLLEIPGRISVPILCRHLDKPNIMVQIRIEEILQKHGCEAMPALVEKVAHTDEKTVARALFILSTLRDTRSMDVCLRALKDSRPRIRAYAIRALGDMLTKSRLTALAPMKDAFEQAGEQGKADPVLAYLADEDALKASLSVALRAFPLDYIVYNRYSKMSPGHKRLTEEFASLLFDHSDEMRLLLSKWIHDINHHKNVHNLLLPLAKDADPLVRANAVYALGQIQDTETLPEIIEALQDPHALVRDAAGLALVFFGDVAVKELSKVMGVRPASFRILALDTLGRIDTQNSRLVIAEYLDAGEPSVQMAAERALGLPQ